MPVPDTVTRTLDYAGSTPMSLGAAAANRSGVRVCALEKPCRSQRSAPYGA